MKKIYLILALVYCYSFTYAQESPTNKQPDRLTAEQMASAEAAYALWFNQLNEQLLASTDSYEMAMGLAAILHGTLRDLSQQSSQQKTADQLTNQIKVLNSVIQQDGLSADTLDLLMNWCFKSEIAQRCDQDTLLNKQLEKTPDNLNVYLKPLQLAMTKKDPALTDKIIALMGQTKYSHSTHFISAAFNQTIDDYIAKNPIPDSSIAAFKDDTALLDGVADKIKVNLDQHIREYFPASIKMSYVYLYDTPDYQPLYEFCKVRPDLFNNCLNITQILINESNSILSKGMGYTILMAMHESTGKKELLQAVQIRQNQYKANIQCLSDATQSNHFMDNFLDSKYQQINLLPIDEYKKLELMANYVYQKNKSNTPKPRNPDDCFQSQHNG